MSAYNNRNSRDDKSPRQGGRGSKFNSDAERPYNSGKGTAGRGSFNKSDRPFTRSDDSAAPRRFNTGAKPAFNRSSEGSPAPQGDDRRSGFSKPGFKKPYSPSAPGSSYKSGRSFKSADYNAEGNSFKDDRHPRGDRPYKQGGFKSEGRNFKGDGFSKGDFNKPGGGFKSESFNKGDSNKGGFNKPGRNFKNEGFNKNAKGFKGDRPTAYRGKDFNNEQSEEQEKTPFKPHKRTGDFVFTNKFSGRKRISSTTPRNIDDESTAEPKNTQQAPKGSVRLNKLIANSGLCSRRKADELIEAGVIKVNGEVITELGYRVQPYTDKVTYNNEPLRAERAVYVLLNKPKDFITTTDDPLERRTVMQLVANASKARIYPVGRLDRNTTGLLLFTNDGNLADKLSHPSNSISKLYKVDLNRNLTQGDMNKIAFGLELEDGFIKPDSISYVSGGTKAEIGIQIHSGKNRIVRRIFEHLGYEVEKLDRVVYGPLTKKDLTRGRWRYLTDGEIEHLKQLVK